MSDTQKLGSREEIESLKAELAIARGIIKADDERLRTAGARVGLECGCDTASDMADQIEYLRRVVADRDAEILRIRTSENAAAVAIDRLRIAMTDLPLGTHPSEIANRIEQADVNAIIAERNASLMSLAMEKMSRIEWQSRVYDIINILDLIYDRKVVGGKGGTMDSLYGDMTRLMSEHFNLRADCKLLAAEVNRLDGVIVAMCRAHGVPDRLKPGPDIRASIARHRSRE